VHQKRGIFHLLPKISNVFVDWTRSPPLRSVDYLPSNRYELQINDQRIYSRFRFEYILCVAPLLIICVRKESDGRKTTTHSDSDGCRESGGYGTQNQSTIEQKSRGGGGKIKQLRARGRN
jgi:hypothetical protein